MGKLCAIHEKWVVIGIKSAKGKYKNKMPINNEYVVVLFTQYLWKKIVTKNAYLGLASNYRPVSLTSILCKILEHALCSNILTDAQHGFRKQRSFESQLILTVQDLAKGIDSREQKHLILLDFSKVFDKVPHERLLHKIDQYGIRGSTHAWLSEFLTDRKQQVFLNGSCSESSPVKSGVPQGSVIGRLMFLNFFINDLPEYVSFSTVRLFADDCVLYKKIKSGKDAANLQKDLDGLQQWEADWLMEFHPQKCQFLRITT